MSQKIKVTQQLKQVIFALDIPSTKYDIRKQFHSSESYSDLTESTYGKYDIMNVEFKSNPKLSYLKNSTRRLADFWFFKGSDSMYACGFDIHYATKFAETSTNQFKELISFFKPISYKTSENPFIVDSVKQGDAFYAYSSSQNYARNSPYLIIINRYVVISSNVTSPPPGEYYELSFNFYYSYLY
jgi:hypothetical protein